MEEAVWLADCQPGVRIVGKPVSKELDREQQPTQCPPLACRCAHRGALATHVTQTYTQIGFDTGSLYVALTGLAVIK